MSITLIVSARFLNSGKMSGRMFGDVDKNSSLKFILGSSGYMGKYLIDECLEGFFSFLSEPQDFKNQWIFDHKVPNDPDTGYIKREGGPVDDGLNDIKEAFHFRTDLLDKLEDRNVNFDNYTGFLMNCAYLFQECMNLIENMVINSTSDFNCNGDGIIAIANFVQFYELLGVNPYGDNIK